MVNRLPVARDDRNRRKDPIRYAAQRIDSADITAVSDALKDPYLTQGPRVAAFEKAIAELCGVRYAVAVNSGTSALHIAALAAGIGPGDEVISTPITFVATTNCIVLAGGEPVFADVDPGTVNIDPALIKKKITPKTKGIIPVHFAGHPCDMERIRKIANDHKLVVIEDAAHALGSAYRGSPTGSCAYSDMTIFSFHAIKHITTGEGGMVTTNNPEFYEKLLMLRTIGITRTGVKNLSEEPWVYEMRLLGFNYRLTDFQCALGLQQLQKLSQFVKRRHEIAAQYNEAFKNTPAVTPLREESWAQSSWHIYPVRVQGDRRAVYHRLSDKGVGVNVHYIPVYRHPYYRDVLGFPRGLCSAAEEYYSQAITLPLHPGLTDDDVQYVITSVVEAVER